MLENLFNLVKEQGADTVINNPDIPNEKNEAVLTDATHSVTEELQKQVSKGDTNQLMSLFEGGNASQLLSGGLLNNPIVRNIISNFTSKLTQNHGIPGDKASTIAGSLIPNVLGSLINKTNDPGNSSFDLKSILGSLMAGNSNGGGFDIGSMVNQFTKGGLDANGDGKVGLDDIFSKITGK